MSPSQRLCLGPGPAHRSLPGESRCALHGGGVPFAGAKNRYHRLPEPVRQAVLTRDGRRCTRCGSVDHLEVDHIQPQSRGGSDDMGNLRTLCRDCHLHLPNAWSKRAG
jgi:hypothetical protein